MTTALQVHREAPRQLTRPLPVQPITKQIRCDLLDNTAGVLISGDPGSGKSVTARPLIAEAARSGDMAVFHFDPPSDAFHDTKRDILSMPPSVQQRWVESTPGDPTKPILPIQPLAYGAEHAASEYERQTRKACKVDHVAHLMLQTFGQGSFDGAPNMFKMMTLTLDALAELGQTIPDGMNFFEGELLHDYAQLLPNKFARSEFAELAQMKPADREPYIGPAKNRYYGLVGCSPIMTAHLGAAEGYVDVDRMIDDRMIVGINGHGDLTPNQRALFFNLWLAELFFAIMNRPAERRVPVLLVCDELSVFTASQELLSFVLPQTRKFQLRFVGITQGSLGFEDGRENRLFRTLVACLNLIIHRHKEPGEARYFGDVVTLPMLDPLAEKFRHYEDEQYTDGFQVQVLIDRSYQEAYSDSAAVGESGGEHQDENWKVGMSGSQTETASVNADTTETAGSTHTDAHSDGKQNSTSDTLGEGEIRHQELIRQSFNKARADVKGSNSSDTSSDATSNSTAKKRGNSASLARQQGRDAGIGGARGWQNAWNLVRTKNLANSISKSVKQQLVPIYRWRRVLRFIELLSMDEQATLGASAVARQGPGQAFVYIAGMQPYQVQFPMPKNYLDRLPQKAAREMRRFNELIFSADWYHDPVTLLEERAKIYQLAVRELQRLKQQQLSLPAPPVQMPDVLDEDEARRRNPRFGL